MREHIAARAHYAGEAANLLLFLGVALVQSVVLWRCHRRYLEHVVLALTVATFFVALTLLALPVIAMFSGAHSAVYLDGAQQIFALTALPVYWWIAIRRFYGLGRLPAAGAAG